MINYKAIEQLEWLWSLIDIKLLTILAAAFTIYFGIQKISKKVAASYSFSSNRLYDTHIPAVILTNKRDNAIAISSINLEIEGKGNLNAIKFDSPLLLKSYESLKIELPKFSRLYKGNELVKLDPFGKIYFHIVTTSGKEIKCDTESAITRQNINKQINAHNVKLNGIVLTDRMSYVFLYKNDDSEKYCVIDKSLVINGDNHFHFNVLERDTLNDFYNIFIEYGYHQRFKNYMLFKINNSLESSLVLNKGMVETKLCELKN
ncbi:MULTISPECIES: hypothetical protein [Citrobacter]|uniref:hypothetical protein n=1 Tax=Citrobacter TaxID=544 RepID=UPI0011F107DE|nr:MULTISPECIES: hypothetical protein [Citrobacter]KAA1148837.1 hypothetical protein D3H39_04580 [Citrobacter portucalensis]MDM2854049.1 hypothetical protein [Citrobacter sp. Cpo065]MDT7469061.1 hypothetical protein [Citrobacter portucalensis]